MNAENNLAQFCIWQCTIASAAATETGGRVIVYLCDVNLIDMGVDILVPRFGSSFSPEVAIIQISEHDSCTASQLMPDARKISYIQHFVELR